MFTRSDYVYGGAARFGFDPRAHLTETSDSVDTRERSETAASWDALLGQQQSNTCVEKTPENLLMTRFLQAVFPERYFIVIRRHPVPVSIANNQKWKVTFTSLHRLFDHWLHCYGLFEEDKKYLKHVYELSVRRLHSKSR